MLSYSYILECDMDMSIIPNFFYFKYMKKYVYILDVCVSVRYVESFQDRAWYWYCKLRSENQKNNNYVINVFMKMYSNHVIIHSPCRY